MGRSERPWENSLPALDPQSSTIDGSYHMAASLTADGFKDADINVTVTNRADKDYRYKIIVDDENREYFFTVCRMIDKFERAITQDPRLSKVFGEQIEDILTGFARVAAEQYLEKRQST